MRHMHIHIGCYIGAHTEHRGGQLRLLATGIGALAYRISHFACFLFLCHMLHVGSGQWLGRVLSAQCSVRWSSAAHRTQTQNNERGSGSRSMRMRPPPHTHTHTSLHDRPSASLNIYLLSACMCNPLTLSPSPSSPPPPPAHTAHPCIQSVPFSQLLLSPVSPAYN
jgi:hypothetical protein